MRHRRQEVGLCLVCGCGFPGCHLKLFIDAEDDREIKYEQDQKAGGNKPD